LAAWRTTRTSPNYRGYFDLKLIFGQADGLQAAFTGRVGDDWDKGSVQMDLFLIRCCKFTLFKWLDVLRPRTDLHRLRREPAPLQRERHDGSVRAVASALSYFSNTSVLAIMFVQRLFPLRERGMM